jgi:hypothetical protein
MCLTIRRTSLASVYVAEIATITSFSPFLSWRNVIQIVFMKDSMGDWAQAFHLNHR